MNNNVQSGVQSFDGPERGQALLALVAVMDRLRSPGGCPWDAAQTHESLVTYLLEETYETIEAIETADRAALREELGDLLLQVVFHARIGQEDSTAPFDIDDVAQGIVDKLIARHPHVFGDVDAVTAEQVEANWQAIKAVEKGRTSVTDGVPRGLPALAHAQKLLTRAEHGGVDIPVTSESAGERADLALGLDDDVVLDEIVVGETLLAIATAAHRAGIDPEAALRTAVSGYRSALRTAEGQTPE
jgi:XTP/dITP diphosphohydrolase